MFSLPLLNPFITLALGLGVYLSFKLSKYIYDQWTSPLNNLPGPPNPSLIYGSMKEIWDADALELHDKWTEEYGSAIRYKHVLGASRLYTADPKAINHILMNTSVYQKPEGVRYGISRILGDGILVVEGDKHKQQRKIMNPAFGAAQIRELTEIFVDKSILLRDIWASEVAKDETGRIDVLSWLSRMTLDVIGLAGFNYNFNALTNDPEKNELNKAFNQIFRSGTALNLINILRGMFPFLRFLPADRDAEAKLARQTMSRIGQQLMSDSKAAVVADEKMGIDKSSASSARRKDLLSLLIRANMSDSGSGQGMSDEDVLAQVPTFLVAGHETTSTATTWALYALSKDLSIQTKLREELVTISTDNPTMDELNSLPYLDAVVREVLRVHSPVSSTVRMAVKDDILPLGTPVTGRNGELLDSVVVKEGQTMLIPVLSLNRAKSLWGEDSREFRPERWLDGSIPDAASSVPGVWGNMMTFLGGPRACIGYRFSLVEMKALLFTLIRAFEFELAVPAEDIVKKTSLVQRPIVLSEKDKGNQMPLRLRPVLSN